MPAVDRIQRPAIGFDSGLILPYRGGIAGLSRRHKRLHVGYHLLHGLQPA